MPFPLSLKHTIRFHAKKHGATWNDGRRIVTGPAFRFVFKTTVAKDIVTFVYEYKTTKPFFDAEQWEEHVACTTKVFNDLQHGVPLSHPILVNKKRLSIYLGLASLVLYPTLSGSKTRQEASLQAHLRAKEISDRKLQQVVADMNKPLPHGSGRTANDVLSEQLAKINAENELAKANSEAP